MSRISPHPPQLVPPCRRRARGGECQGRRNAGHDKRPWVGRFDTDQQEVPYLNMSAMDRFVFPHLASPGGDPPKSVRTAHRGQRRCPQRAPRLRHRPEGWTEPGSLLHRLAEMPWIIPVVPATGRRELGHYDSQTAHQTSFRDPRDPALGRRLPRNHWPLADSPQWPHCPSTF